MAMSARQANLLIEAGLWLRLGGDHEGARQLFARALEQEPSNRQAKEGLARSQEALSLSPARKTSPFEVPLPLLREPPPPPEPRPITLSPLEMIVEEDEEEPEVIVTPLPPDPEAELSLLLRGVDELLSLGDASSAQELLAKAERLLPGDPRLGPARARCEQALAASLEAKLGDPRRVPRMAMRPQELMKLSLAPQEGFVLSRIDGKSSYEALFSVSGMPRLETLRALVRLLEVGAITTS
jgi:tetratricopeptide (TPR) repeat protein